MNDEQLYTLIAKTPQIRAVQIADALNQELVDVSNALRPLVEVGDVIQSDGVSPKGNATQVYTLSKEFLRSAEGVAVMARVSEGSTPAGAAQAIAALRMQASPKAPAGTRVSKAIAYIEQHGRATSIELREVMGLADRTGSPSAYLKCALDDGRVKWDGKQYLIGTPKSPGKAFGGALSLPGSTPHPALPMPAPRPQAAPQACATVQPQSAPALDAPAFRCGIWLDDVVELQRGDISLGKLPRAEALVLRDFLNRVLPAGEVRDA